ncbi:MAG: SRPBCC domain-containing protein [Candidatus Acidiferrales bacterium]
MTNTAPTRSLVIEREMPHPAEKIWRALTQGPLIAEWLMKNDFEPKMGHKFSFRSEPVKGWDGVIDAEVLLLEPHSRLSYSWATMGIASTVTWTLTPTQGGTHLRMEQTGFRSEQDAAYKGASYGWNMFIGKMEQVIGGLQ